MAFTSLSFLAFVTICTVVYFIVPKKIRWWVLLAGSFAFYLLSSPKTFIFLLITITTSFFGAKVLTKQNLEYKTQLAELKERNATKDEKTELRVASRTQKRKVVFVLCLINFGILAFMKYFSVYMEEIFGDALPDWLNFNAGLLIPLGISFYTFTSMSYIIDTYHAKVEAETNIAKFALYVSFFPQIIQGPIARFRFMKDQLYEGHSFSYDRVTKGIQLILWGCMKKMVIADRMAVICNEVFTNYTNYDGITVIVAAVCYSIQIYGDFSGGIDIARGVAEIVGIKLAPNFDQPYFAQNMGDFWNRWHISLSSWTRDYIFYPLSLSKPMSKLGTALTGVLGKRLGQQFPIIAGTFIAFTFIGVWHGAEFKYLAYGFYNAIIISGAMVVAPALKKINKILRVNTEAFSWKVFRMLRTFTLVTIGRLFPRAVSFSAAISMFTSMFHLNPGTFFNKDLPSFAYEPREFIVIFIGLAVWFLVSVLREQGVDVRDSLAKQNLWFRWTIYFALFFSVIIFGVYGPEVIATFIYRGF